MAKLRRHKAKRAKMGKINSSNKKSGGKRK